MTIHVNIHEAKTHFSGLIEQAMMGEDIIIMCAGKPVGKLNMPPKPKKRILGDLSHLAKKYPLPADFDDPMPEEWFDSSDEDHFYRS